MSCPRIFVSSTYYDLKHVRSSLENFIEQLGYESILSEKGDIAYAPDISLDESCYREVRNADIFVLIIGGRYGAEKSEGKKNVPKQFYDRYDSITKQEYTSAVDKDIPIYILIEKSVYADFETFLKNKDNKTISYAHVDSVNIFQLIEEILSRPRNNPIHHFDRYSEIEEWLREQWAGLFKELLSRKSSQQQISSLSTQVKELSEVNKTLKAYLEQVVSKIAPDESAKIIKTESKRLDNALQRIVLERNSLACHLTMHGNSPEEVHKAAISSKTLEEFLSILKQTSKEPLTIKKFLSEYRKEADQDYDELRLAISNPDKFVDDNKNLLPNLKVKQQMSKKDINKKV